jgi:hypothetical protein
MINKQLLEELSVDNHGYNDPLQYDLSECIVDICTSKNRKENKHPKIICSSENVSLLSGFSDHGMRYTP